MPDERTIASQAVPPRRVSRIFGQYIIKNRFQFKFSGVIFLFLSAASFTIWFEGQWAINRMVSAGLIESEAAIEHFAYMNQLIAYTGCLAIAITFLLSLFFSHYIAGPIYRFEKTLEEMRSGNLTVFVKLRKHDEFKETAELFNQTITSLRNKVKKERETMKMVADKLKVQADAMRQAGRTQEATELEQAIFDINNQPPQIKI